MKPKMHIASCSFGKDSIATILLALENNEPLDRVVFAEVMFDHKRNISGEIPEHIQWIYGTAIPKLEAMGVKVDVVRAKKDYVTLCKQVLKSGNKKGQMYGIQYCNPCYANGELKLNPIRKYIAKYNKEYDVIQYVGIAIDEPKRLARLKGTNTISLLEKYKHTENDALWLCEKNNLLSPIYKICRRGGCWFCHNATIQLYCSIRNQYPLYWQSLCQLYHETNSKFFKFNKTLKQVEKEMDVEDFFNERQLKLFV